jgi:Cu(I)/Ag(I) efflux system membrane fusion protein
MIRTVSRLVSGFILVCLLAGCGNELPSTDSGLGLPAENESAEGAAAGRPASAGLPSDVSQADQRKIKYWVAPMDPTFISDEPGKSPMGMDLVPVYEGGGGSADPKVIAIDPAVVQNMGIRTARVSRKTLFRHVRTIGEVEVGEDELSVVNLRFSGWVENIYADKTGDPVVKGATLFDIYSPELVAAQGEFLLALRTQGAKSNLARSARRKLELWDVEKREIDAIAREGQVRRVLPIRAPRSGFILEKNIVDGAHVQAGSDVYHIADLAKIWVTAEIYEHDAPWVEVGQPAQMELTYEPGRVIEGRVGYIYPTLDKSSRTLKVRLEFANPDNRLKPGMFATLYIQFQRRDDVLAVPTEAIIHSGVRQIVFITQDDGHFEPREITTGLVGDRDGTEILSGLSEGSLVVVSGQFLLDSESQLNEAISKMLDRKRGSAASAAASTPADASAIWSCPMHPEVAAEEFGRCPICGMDLEKRAGSAAGLHGIHAEHQAGPASMGDDSHAREDEATGVEYVCPMHPEETSSQPGRCPICGMFLDEQKQEGGGS